MELLLFAGLVTQAVSVLHWASAAECHDATTFETLREVANRFLGRAVRPSDQQSAHAAPLLEVPCSVETCTGAGVLAAGKLTCKRDPSCCVRKRSKETVLLMHLRSGHSRTATAKALHTLALILHYKHNVRQKAASWQKCAMVWV